MTSFPLKSKAPVTFESQCALTDQLTPHLFLSTSRAMKNSRLLKWLSEFFSWSRVLHSIVSLKVEDLGAVLKEAYSHTAEGNASIVSSRMLKIVLHTWYGKS